MKKKKALLLVLLLFLYSGCGNEKQLNYIDNDVMNKNFKETLKDAYVQSEEISSVQLMSLETELAPIKMLSLQNLYGLQNVEIEKYKEKYNEYKFSIEKSIYLKENHIALELLTNQSIEEDFYDAYYVSEWLNDKQLRELITQRYHVYTGSSYESLSEEVYRFLNSQYAEREDASEKEKVQQKVYEYIEQKVEEDVIDVTVDGLTDMLASLAFLSNSKDSTMNTQVQSLYEDFINEDNEESMLFDMDISMAYYARCISYMRNILNIQAEEDFFYQQAMKGNDLYMGVTYDVTSPKNFAMYVMGLCFNEEKIKEEQYDTLSNLFVQIQNTINPNDYMSMYYLKLAARLLNIDFKMDTVSAMNDEKSYYYLLLTNTKLNFDDLYYENEGIETLLYACDCSTESSEKISLLKDISILDYQNKTEFPMLLNLYVVNMVKNDLLDEEKEEAILEFIQSKECDYGYAEEAEAYDFRTSVYYTNILYLLNGGNDYGLR